VSLALALARKLLCKRKENSLLLEHTGSLQLCVCTCLLQGNLVSEFGFGSRKEAAMALVDSFEPTYWFKQLRVAGDDLRLLRAYPGKWQVRTY
jgi:hypothetical protein